MYNKLMRLYGDTMTSIGIWFFNRGERYATWIELPKIDIKDLDVR